MDKKEALKVLTDDDQYIIDSFYPLQFNKKWTEAYEIAVNNLRKEVEKMKIKYYVFYEDAGSYYHFTSVQENKINTYEELENLCKTRWEKKKEEKAKFNGIAYHDQQPNESRHWVWNLEKKREEKK